VTQKKYIYSSDVTASAFATFTRIDIFWFFFGEKEKKSHFKSGAEHFKADIINIFGL
jgi:hypothetical protein